MPKRIAEGAGDRLLAHREAVVDEHPEGVHLAVARLHRLVIDQHGPGVGETIRDLELRELLEDPEAGHEMLGRETDPGNRAVAMAERRQLAGGGATDDPAGVAA